MQIYLYIYILILFYLSPFINPFENISHIFLFSSLIFTSEREYRCLGNWEEDGVLYTFTQRRDMPGHQCFVSNYFVLFFFCCFVIIDSCNNFDSILYKKLYCKIMKLFFSLSYKTGRQSLSQWWWSIYQRSGRTKLREVISIWTFWTHSIIINVTVIISNIERKYIII